MPHMSCKHASGVQCECVKDGWRWNADHAGTLVWQGREPCHGNIAQCNSGYQVPVHTKHGVGGCTTGYTAPLSIFSRIFN